MILRSVRPLLATPTSHDVQELSFEFQGAGNLKSPEEGHQHHLVIRFVDANDIVETWTWHKGDKDTLMVFHFSRKSTLFHFANSKEFSKVCAPPADIPVDEVCLHGRT